MEKLVQNGEVYLDGTDPKYVKEKKIYSKLEKIQNYEEKMQMDAAVLFKALFEGIVYFKDQGEIKEAVVEGIGKTCLFTSTGDLLYEDYGRTWSIHETDLTGQTQKFEDCYVEMTMTLKNTEMFDEKGNLCIVGNRVRTEILHPDQVNDPKQRQQWQVVAWRRWCKEHGWDKNNPVEKSCTFRFKPIAKKSKPITLNKMTLQEEI